MSLDKGGRGGVVVNISSVAGLDSLFSVPAYGASKNGIVGLTRAFGVSCILKFNIYCIMF